MSRLSFISDDDLKECVRFVLEKTREIRASKKNAEAIYKNVLDPFAAMFEMAFFYVDSQIWFSNEKIRQDQKSFQNHVGTFHQKVLGKMVGWVDLGVGGNCDLVCHERKIIAEVKNKYCTVTGSKLKDLYTDLDDLVMPKSSCYKGYVAYYVQIIPKYPVRFNIPFVPSDKSTGSKKPSNELIRSIDGYSFYGLVTGIEDALDQLYKVLPELIEEINNETPSQFLNCELLNQLFHRAFIAKPSKRIKYR